MQKLFQQRCMKINLYKLLEKLTEFLLDSTVLVPILGSANNNYLLEKVLKKLK